MSDFENRLEVAVADFERNFRPLTEEERLRIYSDAGKATIKQNAKVAALLDPGTLVLQELESRGLGVIRIRQADKSFVIGSFPIVKLLSADATGFTLPTQVWFPISHDVAVTPAGRKGSEQFTVVRDEKFIRAINLAVAHQSAAIAGRSEALIASLAKPR